MNWLLVFDLVMITWALWLIWHVPARTRAEQRAVGEPSTRLGGVALLLCGLAGFWLFDWLTHLPHASRAAENRALWYGICATATGTGGILFGPMRVRPVVRVVGVSLVLSVALATLLIYRASGGRAHKAPQSRAY
jgi:hypothetical protein